MVLQNGQQAFLRAFSPACNQHTLSGLAQIFRVELYGVVDAGSGLAAFCRKAAAPFAAKGNAAGVGAFKGRHGQGGAVRQKLRPFLSAHIQSLTFERLVGGSPE